MIVADAGPLVAFADADDPRHAQVRDFIEKTNEHLVVSPFVLAEVDYLVGRLCGIDAELEVLRDVAAGLLGMDPLDNEDVAACLEVVERYRDLEVGLADASVVVLAHRHATNRVLTFDERHFRAMRSLDGKPFVLLPADEVAG